MYFFFFWWRSAIQPLVLTIYTLSPEPQRSRLEPSLLRIRGIQGFHALETFSGWASHCPLMMWALGELVQLLQSYIVSE